MCMKGPQCPFAHGTEELRPLPDLRCTKMCKTMLQIGKCQDQQCRYAHTEEELRSPKNAAIAGSIGSGAMTHSTHGLGIKDIGMATTLPPGFSWDDAVGNSASLDYAADDAYATWPLQPLLCDKQLMAESNNGSSGLELGPIYVPLPSVGLEAEGTWGISAPADSLKELPEPQLILGPLASQEIAEPGQEDVLGAAPAPASFGTFQPDRWSQVAIDQAGDQWVARNLQLQPPLKSKPMRTVRTSESTLCTLSDERP